MKARPRCAFIAAVAALATPAALSTATLTTTGGTLSLAYTTSPLLAATLGLGLWVHFR